MATDGPLPAQRLLSTDFIPDPRHCPGQAGVCAVRRARGGTWGTSPAHGRWQPVSPADLSYRSGAEGRPAAIQCPVNSAEL